MKPEAPADGAITLDKWGIHCPQGPHKLKQLLEEFRRNGTETGMTRDDAKSESVLRPILSRLLKEDREAFDALMWLIWWVAYKEQACDWREKKILELMATQRNEIGTTTQ